MDCSSRSVFEEDLSVNWRNFIDFVLVWANFHFELNIFAESDGVDVGLIFMDWLDNY